MSKGTLYVVATPIGNLEDISMRSIRILREVSLIACEDTRHTGILLRHFDIHTRTISFFEHNETVRIDYLLKILNNGESVALVSDAGTPAISDPGFKLVREAIREGVNVSPIPGSSAAIAALSVSGLPVNRFAFEGFLPTTSGARTKRLDGLKKEERTMIFYESPKRLLSTLSDIHDRIGDRDAVIARELTKRFEECVRGKVSGIISQLEGRDILGEIVIVVDGLHDEGSFDGSIAEELRRAVAAGLTMKEAVGVVSERFSIPKKEVYMEGLKLKKEEEN